MDGVIRKISIGLDYKSGSMHYIVGQKVLGGKYEISDIFRKGSGNIVIYIIKDKEIVLWKSFSPTVPISIEYNINF